MPNAPDYQRIAELYGVALIYASRQIATLSGNPSEEIRKFLIHQAHEALAEQEQREYEATIAEAFRQIRQM